MSKRIHTRDTFVWCAATALASFTGFACAATGEAQTQSPVESRPGLVAPATPQEQPLDHECTIDLALTGMMKDIISNAMIHGLHRPAPEVAAFLASVRQYANGPELLSAAAKHFKMDEAVLAAEVQKFKHCNCAYLRTAGAKAGDDPAPPVEQQDVEVSAFAKNVTLHVVLHELGHALIREFDIPILGNEETAADAFATYYLTTYLPDRAVDVLMARTTSLMIEAGEARVVDLTGEHDPDARRAYQIAALAVAADAKKYDAIATLVGMSDADVKDARDYGAEIHRSWRRVLGPLWMPDGAASSEARVLYDARSPFSNGLCSDGLAKEIESAAMRFDWHSQVTVRFVDGDGGAAWSRSSRTVTVHSGYVRRFIEQGTRGLTASR